MSETYFEQTIADSYIKGPVLKAFLDERPEEFGAHWTWEV